MDGNLDEEIRKIGSTHTEAMMKAIASEYAKTTKVCWFYQIEEGKVINMVEVQARVDSLLSRINELMGERAAKQAEILRLTTEKARFQTEMAAERKAKKAEVDKLTAVRDQLMAEMTAERDVSRAEVAKSTKLAQQLNDQISAIQAQFKQLKGENFRLDEKVEVLGSELRDVKKEKTKLSAAMAAMMAERDAQRSEIDALKADRNRKAAEATALKIAAAKFVKHTEASNRNAKDLERLASAHETSFNGSNMAATTTVSDSAGGPSSRVHLETATMATTGNIFHVNSTISQGYNSLQLEGSAHNTTSATGFQVDEHSKTSPNNRGESDSDSAGEERGDPQQVPEERSEFQLELTLDPGEGGCGSTTDRTDKTAEAKKKRRRNRTPSGFDYLRKKSKKSK